MKNLNHVTKTNTCKMSDNTSLGWKNLKKISSKTLSRFTIRNKNIIFEKFDETSGERYRR
jgi:hypothetical protein